MEKRHEIDGQLLLFQKSPGIPGQLGATPESPDN